MQTQGWSKIKQRTLFMDHDGNPDDIISLILALSMPNVNLIGVTITPADCYMDSAQEMTLKCLSIFGKEIGVGLGDYESPNQFPDSFKLLSIQSNQVPLFLNQRMNTDLLPKSSAEVFMAKTIRESPEKVTVLLTGPCTHLTKALALDPGIKANIEEVVWMGGAVDVGGNIDRIEHDSSAEWNVYWDCVSAQQLFASGLPITIFSLDATNKVPLDIDFLKRLARHTECRLTHLVAELYSTVFIHTPKYMEKYFMWDTLCAGYLGCDGLATFERVELDVMTKKPSQGRTFRSPGCGQWINFAKDVQAEKFREFLIQVLLHAETRFSAD